MKLRWIVIKDGCFKCEGKNYQNADALAKTNKAILAKDYFGRIIRVKDYSNQ